MSFGKKDQFARRGPLLLYVDLFFINISENSPVTDCDLWSLFGQDNTFVMEDTGVVVIRYTKIYVRCEGS